MRNHFGSVVSSRNRMGARRAADTTGQVDLAGKPLDISQGRPNRSVEIIEADIRCDETVAAIQPDRRANEGAINIDHMRL